VWIFDLLSVILIFGSVPGAICLAVRSYFRSRGGVARKLGVALSHMLGAFVLAFYSGVVLLYRDGFHPDGVPSKGIAGVLGALPDIGVAALAGGGFAALGWLIQVAGKRDERPG